MGIRIGFGLGPVSVSTGMRFRSSGRTKFDDDDAAALFGIVLLAISLVVAFYFIVWPFRFSQHLSLDAGLGAQNAKTVAWVVEIAYLVLLLVVTVKVRRWLRRLRETAARRQEALSSVQTLTQYGEIYQNLSSTYVAGVEMLIGFIEVMRDEPNGIDAAEIGQPPAFTSHGFELSPDERLLGLLHGVGLTMPRVESRNGPKVQTTVAHGLCVVTDKHVRFLSTERHETWRVAAITAVIKESPLLLLPVSTRRTIYGLDTSSVDCGEDLANDFLVALVEWARGLPAAPIQQIEDLEDCVALYTDSITRTNSKLASTIDELETAKELVASLSD